MRYNIIMDTHPEPTLLELIRYNNWANAQILVACQKLTHEQLAFSMPGVYGSINATLAHILRAEAEYIRRLTGVCPQPPFNWVESYSLEDLSTYAVSVANALLETVINVAPEYLVHEEEDGNTIDYLARLLFIQVISHGIEHRTNITTILGYLGETFTEIDGWGYLFAHPDTFSLKETFKATKE